MATATTKSTVTSYDGSITVTPRAGGGQDASKFPLLQSVGTGLSSSPTMFVDTQMYTTGASSTLGTAAATYLTPGTYSFPTVSILNVPNSWWSLTATSLFVLVTGTTAATTNGTSVPFTTFVSLPNGDVIQSQGMGVSTPAGAVTNAAGGQANGGPTTWIFQMPATPVAVPIKVGAAYTPIGWSAAPTALLPNAVNNKWIYQRIA